MRALLMVVVLGCLPESRTAELPDAGTAADAGAADAGGLEKDAGPTTTDAGTTDAGSAPVDGGPHSMDAGLVDAGPPPGEVILGGDRPAPMKVPSGYDGSPHPLVILLHGLGVDAAIQDGYFGLSTRVDERGFFLMLPDGTIDQENRRFWAATPACCDFYGTGVDDVGYLNGLIAEAQSMFSIDRVYFIGHSNGGFMSYRMACERSDLVRAVVSLAGSSFLAPDACGAQDPISVLQIHGTADNTVFYGGLQGGYPGAEPLVRRWAGRAGCDTAQLETGEPIDLDTALPGDETEVETYRTGCAPGVEAELWRITNGGHIPALDASDFSAEVLDWILAH